MTLLSDTCSKCGCRMGPSSEGLCPACLLMGVLEHGESPEPPAVETPSRMPQRIEQYELRGEIARGGMGVVYRAEDTTTGRIVALKMLASASFAGSDELRRFRQEGEAVARLEHPNVVPVYEVGEFEGVPYFVMKVAEGGSLALRAAPVENREAATMLLRIARAVQFAHERGVLHRDLKPANILLDVDSTPMVCDFGLARLNDQQGYTLTGAGIGTPSYMAPEQASGGATPTTTLSDVYGLGAVLYHQLSGVAPFVGTDTLAVLRQLATDEPLPPRTHNNTADRDLEQVALKAMSKNPADRYRSAAAFADELERWLRGEPTVARSPGMAVRLWKWARRKPATAVAVLLTLAAAAALATVITNGEIAVRHERNIALGAEAVSRKQERKAIESEHAMRLNLYAADMLVAARALRDGHLGVARETLARHLPKDGVEDLRGFEWYAFQADCRGDDFRALTGHQKSVLAAEFSADGKTLATTGRDSRILFWDVGTGALKSEIPKSDTPTNAMELPLFAKNIASSPDARGMLASNPKLFDGIRMRWRPSRIGHTQTLAWSPDGRWLASGASGSFLRIWDLSTNELDWFAPIDAVTKVEFSPDGAYLLALRIIGNGASGELLIYDTKSHEQVRKIGDIRPSFAVLFPSDEIVVARTSGELERQIIGSGAVVSKMQTSTPIHDLSAARGKPLVASLDFSATQITLWDLSGGTRVHRFSNPSGERFRDFAFSPDGTDLAAVGADHLLRIVDVETFTERQRLRGHGDEILGVRYSPDGSLIATAGNDQTARLWSAIGQKAVVEPETEPSPIFAGSTLSPHVLIQHGDGVVECWNSEARTSAMTPAVGKRAAAGFASADGGFFTTRRDASGGIAWERWNPDGTPAAEPRVLTPTILNWYVSAATPRADFLAVSDGKRAIEIFALDGDAKTRRIEFERRLFDRLQFSPDGKLIAGYSWPDRVSVWDVASGADLGRRQIAQGAPGATVISPDSKLLASAGDDNVITIQDLSTGTHVATLRGHKAQVRALAFSLDGKTLASASSDQTLRLWHVATWREMGVLQRGSEFTALAFSGVPQRLVAIGPRGRSVFPDDFSAKK